MTKLLFSHVRLTRKTKASLGQV